MAARGRIIRDNCPAIQRRGRCSDMVRNGLFRSQPGAVEKPRPAVGQSTLAPLIFTTFSYLS